MRFLYSDICKGVFLLWFDLQLIENITDNDGKEM